VSFLQGFSYFCVKYYILGFQRTPYFKKKVFVFRQWSRKAYAIFNSLHKEVNIGCLNMAIANTLGTKTASKATSAIVVTSKSETEPKPDSESVALNVAIEQLLIAIAPQPRIVDPALSFRVKNQVSFFIYSFYFRNTTVVTDQSSIVKNQLRTPKSSPEVIIN